MLQAARAKLADRSRVVFCGAAPVSGTETQPQPEGLHMMAGAEAIPFDLDEVLRRRPDLLLLPGLADRNAPGVRHRRRHQDVRELLDAGIDVWSTLEVRHVEGLADVVERITGSRQADTVPDAVVDQAEEVELIDLPPEELLARTRRSGGPISRSGDTTEARPEPAVLVALREIALRYAADRLNNQTMPQDGDAPHAGASWPTVERLLVCVGPSPTSARVVRTASRMAHSLRARWTVVHVGATDNAADVRANRVSHHLQLAESLGAEAVVIPGGDVALELLEFARSHNITKIVIGKTGTRRWKLGFHRSLVERLIAASGEIDVYVIRGTEEGPDKVDSVARKAPVRLRPYLASGAALLLGTGIAWAFDRLGFNEAELVSAYLLAVTVVAVRLGRGPAVFASFGAVLLFNFFFTSPRFTFEVHDTGYLFTFAVMLVIGLMISTLTARIRDHSIAARERERRTEQLCQLSQDLSATTGHLQIAHLAEGRLSGLLDREVAILLPGERGRLRPAGRGPVGLPWNQDLQAAAAWVYEHGRIAGAGTDTHADAPALCLPLSTPEGVVGVMAVRASDPDLLLYPDRRRLIETFAAQVALALQRNRLSEQVHRTLAEAENERLRNAVLSSVSHDFRTPLAAITGASSSLLDAGDRIDPGERTDLIVSIYEEADRLARLVDNLLHMTKLDSGQLQPRREWNVVEDIVGSALTRLGRQLAAREVTTRVARDLPLLDIDGVLVELVLTNLLDNAAKYSAPQAPIAVEAKMTGGWVEIAVADRGPGLTFEEKGRAFEKFYRGPARCEDGSRGAGLGLSICHAIIQLHGGRIHLEDRHDGGARFVVSLPIEVQPPPIPVPPAETTSEEP